MDTGFDSGSGRELQPEFILGKAVETAKAPRTLN